jgi:hypothetical protein
VVDGIDMPRSPGNAQDAGRSRTPTDYRPPTPEKDKPVREALTKTPEKTGDDETRLHGMAFDECVQITFAGATQIVGLKKATNIIGRRPMQDPPPDIILDDPEQKFISRKHAVIDFVNGKWCVKDLGSRNGTRLNGTKMIPNQVYPLKFGDVIEIEGRQLEFMTGNRHG